MIVFVEQFYLYANNGGATKFLSILIGRYLTMHVQCEFLCIKCCLFNYTLIRENFSEKLRRLDSSIVAYCLRNSISPTST